MLKELSITALRGATNTFTLSFEKGKKITIVYGENGSGKSTICDAIEFLADGNIGSLEGKGLGRTGSYWHSTGRKPADVCVRLITSSGNCETKLNRGKASIVLADYKPKVAVLRRSELQNLIAQQPKDRYDVVRPFIDTRYVDDAEGKLDRLLKDETKNRTTAIAVLDANRDAVENFWKSASSPGLSPIDWARETVEKAKGDVQKEINEIESIVNRISSLETEKTKLLAARLEEAQRKEAVKLAENVLANEKAKTAENMESFVPLLQAAQRIFQDAHHPEKCPLCGSSEFVTGLPEKVEAELNAIQNLVNAIDDLRNSKANHEQSIALNTRQASTVDVLTGELCAELQKETLGLGLVLEVEIVERAKAYQTFDRDSAEKSTAAFEIAEKSAQMLVRMNAAVESAKGSQRLVETLRKALATYDANFRAQKDLDLLIPRMESALEEIREERRSYVDKILKDIATRVGELYEEIHPNEGTGKIKLMLDPNQRASLEIFSEFPKATEDVPPGAYLSESHLDSLGLCIYLVLAGLTEKQNTILVLDDIVASMDEPHVDRLVELLYREAEGFQHCLITTHYRPWREKYRWGWLRDKQVQFVDLLPWSHAVGIKYGKLVPQVERLREELSKQPPDAQIVSASSGVILEAILDFLTLLYECSVPRKRGNSTLGDLLPSVKGKLRKALRIERWEKVDGAETQFTEAFLEPILDDLQNLANTRNIIGCHFNDLAQHLPDKDAIFFSTKVLELADLLIDSEAGWPGSNKSGSYWATANDSRRLHPLQQPS